MKKTTFRIKIFFSFFSDIFMLNIETHLLQESFIDLFHILNIGVLEKIFKNCLLHIVYMDKTTSDFEPFLWSRGPV